ncbi:hypothetical protein BN970_00727 [Mycolicibacterium conceptionense]|uniref:Tocopherol cyclase n=1 Tax=Mycolicibacterium conceptionense TaxID=451644 RepID=A0A0U1D1I4_9MYCO|nr:hypothetical protein BN970_00727 [Mycolicibacterium conceptionense]
MDAVEALTWPGRELVALYRRTGADVPFGDPLPSHGTEMEGWFWRLTDAASGRVVVALCSSNQHPDGDWSTSAIALEPGATVRSAAINGVKADQRDFVVRADDGGDVLDADRSGLRLTVDDLTVNLTVDNTQPWPKAFGGGGVFSSVPFLNQYWQPYCLGGLASGTVKGPDVDWQFDEARLYCERNWGAGFPQRWWWGQAHDFGTDDVCVAFSGGLLELGPLAQEVTGVVVRLGPRVLRITPPAPMDYHFDRDNWHWRIRLAHHNSRWNSTGMARRARRTCFPCRFPRNAATSTRTMSSWLVRCVAPCASGARSSLTAPRRSPAWR